MGERKEAEADDDEDDEKEHHVIFGGLGQEQDEQTIIDKITEITNTMRVSDKIVKIFTFTDPSRIGVAQFKSVAGRNGFLKRMHTAGHKWNEQDKMWCKSNTTLEQRIVDKTLG